LCVLLLLLLALCCGIAQAVQSELRGRQAPAFDTLSTLPYRLSFPRGSGPLYDNSRVYPSACSTCQHFVSTLAKAVLTKKLVGMHYNITDQAQILCTQDGLAPSLQVECNNWKKIQSFLHRLGFFSRVKSDIAALKFYPRSYCADVDRCRAPNTPPRAVGANSFSIVRFKMLKNVTALLPPAHKSWPVFVKLFLSDLAKAVHVAPERLELHGHAISPDVAEVVIKPPLNSLQKMVDSQTRQKDDKELVEGDDPVQYVADRMKRLIETGQLNRDPDRSTALIDTQFSVQVFVLNFKRAFKYFNGLIF